MSEVARLKQICVDNGICTDCGRHWVHHMDEPFASCGCKTGEDTTFASPFMRLQKKYAELEVECANLKNNPEFRGSACE